MPTDPYEFLAVTIAAFALLVTLWQLSVIRKHNKLSVRPYLTFWESHDGATNAYSLYLQNNGIGPAIITSFSVYVDHKRIDGRGDKALEKAAFVLFKNSNVLVERAYVNQGYSMAANEKRRLIQLNLKAITPPLTMTDLEQVRDRVRIVIEYNSIYDESPIPPLDSDDFKTD